MERGLGRRSKFYFVLFRVSGAFKPANYESLLEGVFIHEFSLYADIHRCRSVIRENYTTPIRLTSKSTGQPKVPTPIRDIEMRINY
jgi:hypothetical protein